MIFYFLKPSASTLGNKTTKVSNPFSLTDKIFFDLRVVSC